MAKKRGYKIDINNHQEDKINNYFQKMFLDNSHYLNDKISN